MTLLSTPRLALRPPTADDAEPWHAVVWGDPDVACWLPPRAPITVDRLMRFITERALPQWDEHGFGIWLLTEHGGGLVGHCGLVVNEPGRVDLIYAVGRPWWGRGVATEAAHSVVKHAFGPLHLDHLAAFVIPGNEASVRVLEKLGFEAAGTATMFDTELVRFELPRRRTPCARASPQP